MSTTGKGTQAERLMKKYALASVSSGDLLRQSVRDQTPIGMVDFRDRE